MCQRAGGAEGVRDYVKSLSDCKTMTSNLNLASTSDNLRQQVLCQLSALAPNLSADCLRKFFHIANDCAIVGVYSALTLFVLIQIVATCWDAFAQEARRG